MKIPREKEGGKTNIVCIHIYMASLRGRWPRKRSVFFSSFSPLLALLYIALL